MIASPKNIKIFRNNFISPSHKSSRCDQSTAATLLNIKNEEISSKPLFNTNLLEKDFKFFESQINYYYLEINKKNKRITELKRIISELTGNKDDKLNQEISSKKYAEKNNQDKNFDSESLFAFNSQKSELFLKINKLEKENSFLRQKINKKQKKEELLYEQINEKLLKAENDIKILSNENINNNNILLAVQNFLFNVCEVVFPNHKNKTDNEILFDLSLIDTNTFINNLQILESQINKFFELKKVGNICLSGKKPDYDYSGFLEQSNKILNNYKKYAFPNNDENNFNKPKKMKLSESEKVIAKKYNSKIKKNSEKFSCGRNINNFCVNDRDIRFESQKPMNYSKNKIMKENEKKGKSVSYKKKNIKNDLFFNYGN